MADDSDKTGAAANLPQQPVPDIPPSKPLQWFLFGALVITGASYIAGLWAGMTSDQTLAHREIKLRRLQQAQNGYLEHSKAGDEALAKKQYDQAVSEYRLALQSQNDASSRASLGQALLKQGNPDEAFAQFLEALRMNPDSVNVASAWGLALTAQDRPEEAAQVLRQALQRNPDSGLLHYNLADALLRERTDAEGRRRVAAAAGNTKEAQAAETDDKGLAADALAHFATASRDKMDSPAFWSDYGQLLNQLGKYAEAESCLVRAVSEDADMVAAHFQLGVAGDHLGKYAEAIAHYEKVLTLVPDDPATLNDLALLYVTAGNPEARTPRMAVLLATRACDATSSQNARYMDTLARAYAAAGDFFQAITWEEKAIRRARQLNDEDLARELEARDALFIDHKNQ